MEQEFTLPVNHNVVTIESIRTPVAYRDIHEDKAVINSIFKWEEYRLPTIKNYQPKLILDCGGNIGCAAVYYANKYPSAQIYSVEPEQENFQFLQYNTAGYENIHLIKSALWDKETFIRVEDKGYGKWGFMTFATTADGKKIGRNDPCPCGSGKTYTTCCGRNK